MLKLSTITLAFLCATHSLTAQESEDIITEQIEYNVLIKSEHPSIPTRQTLAADARQAFLNRILLGVKSKAYKATKLKDGQACPTCELTYRELRDMLEPVSVKYYEDQDTGEVVSVHTRTPFSENEFVNISFIEDWSFDSEGNLIKTVKAVGFLLEVFDAYGERKRYWTLAHIWFGEG